jgi:hypothetical protein
MNENVLLFKRRLIRIRVAPMMFPWYTRVTRSFNEIEQMRRSGGAGSGRKESIKDLSEPVRTCQDVSGVWLGLMMAIPAR